MKTKLWLILTTTLSTTLIAQASDALPTAQTNSPTASALSAQPAAAAAAAQPAAESAPKAAPAPKPAKPTSARTAAVRASELKTTPLVPGPAVVVAHRVNVRGQAKLKSEVLTRLTNGEPVTVLEEIELKRSGAQEPSAWAKIRLPGHAHTWVHATYIDANKTVTANKLNIRGGPGENYSILGQLMRGETVNEIQTKGRWIEIEPPTNAYAFVAAEYLSQEAPALAMAEPGAAAAAPAEAEPAPAPTSVAEEPEVAAAAAETPATAMAVMTNEMASAEAGEAEAAPPVEEPPPPRIVQRQGIVRYTTSIQAPTTFELISPDTHRPLDYLYTTSTNLDLNRYKGLHIIVTGEEGLDERWRNTPIITIQRIQVVE